MQRHKHCATLRVGHRGPVVERRVLIAAARLHHLKSLCLQCSPNLKRQVQHQIAFANALRAARSRIGSTMDVQRLYALSAELKDEVDRTSPDTVLSFSVLKRTQDIEKLAKQIRDRARK